jgi:hypothetical protein
MSDGLDVRGGTGGIGARTDDMRMTATRLAGTNDTLEESAGHARGAAMSGVLARTTIFSPMSAAQAEGSLVQAAAAVTGLTLRLEAAILLLRTRAKLFELADSGEYALDLLVALGTFGGPIDLARWALGGPNPLSAHPEITDVITAGLASTLSGLGTTLPRDYDGVLALLQGLTLATGITHAGPVRITRAQGRDCVRMSSLADVVRSMANLASGPADPDDRSAVRIVKVEHPGRRPTWVVQIPGTDFGGGKHDPSDAGPNFSLMQGNDPLLDRVLDAMDRSDIARGDRVMVTGHSQGGIAAMALASSPEAQRRFNITNVVTAGSPVGRFRPPPSVHVLSIEHHQDPVPRVDLARNPDNPQWTTITRDVGDNESVQASPGGAHHAALYTETAGLIDADPDPRVAAARADLAPFLGISVDQRDYILVRP